MLNNKAILITGGTGSFGKKMIQVVLSKYKPRRLIVFSRDELKQFEMAQRWSPHRYSCLEYVIGDVRDKYRLERVFENIDYVIHAAALKQVPAAERNPCEYIKTNVLGAMNVIDAAAACNVRKTIALSTDKACNPINLYGATKLCSDKLFVAANASFMKDNRTKFAVVRYGNVLGSRGSVIPFFQERAKTGFLPITDRRMSRFWITLDQAVHFVIASLNNSKGGEIFVPRVPSMKIVDLARAIDSDCKHKIVGIRPGEKLHEVLISEDEARDTVKFDDYFVVQHDEKLRNDLLKHRGQLCPSDFRYSSDNNPDLMSVDELKSLVEKISDDYSIETSRWSMDDVPE